MFVSPYCWIGLGFMVYAVARGFLEVGARLPNDFSSTLVTLSLLVLGGILMVIAYRQTH